MSRRAGLGAEHPLNDRGQVVFVLTFLVVWVLDSFFFHWSTILDGPVPIYVRLPLGILTFLVGVYLIAKAERVIFGRTLVGREGEATFHTTGVYAWVRHPMYLGSLLALLGFFFTTLSLLSLLVWVALFVFYDRTAAFEERDLVRIIGEEYKDYQRRVPKWLFLLRRGQKPG